jgi:Tol biopolymer transport system component
MSQPKRLGLKRKIAFGLAGGLVLAAAAVVAAFAWNARDGSASAAEPSGTLAIPARGSHLNTFSDLHLIDADGSNRRVLARCPLGSGDARWLRYPFGCEVRSHVWSPDGTKLALFRGPRGGARMSPDAALYVVGTDGSREVSLPGCGRPRWSSCGDLFESKPTWAPDGTRLIVQRGGRLLMIDVVRRRFRHLTHGCERGFCFDLNPAWSPDGSRIAFARTEGPRSRSLFSIEPDGSGLKRLTTFPGWWTGGPVWSPDGRRIAFDSVSEAGPRIHVMAADGSDKTLLASGPRFRGPSGPFWSPDGTQLVYASTVALRHPRPNQVAGPGFALEVRMINSDGSGDKRLYRSHDGLVHYVRPAWSPDGRYISFGVLLGNDQGPDRERSGTFVMKADGTGIRKLTDSAVDAAWRPIP